MENEEKRELAAESAQKDETVPETKSVPETKVAVETDTNSAAVPEKKGNKKPAKEKKAKKHKNPYPFLRWLIPPLYRLIFPFKYINKQPKPQGACIWVGNHYTIMDIIFPAKMTDQNLHYLYKKELRNSAFMRFWLDRCETICVDRGANDVRSVMDSLKYLKNGEQISLFPEGTRNKTDAEMLPFMSGATMFAIKAKVPIYPFMIDRKPKAFRMTKIIVGEPFEFTEYYGKRMKAEDYAEADNKLRERMLALRRDYFAQEAAKKQAKIAAKAAKKQAKTEAKKAKKQAKLAAKEAKKKK